MARKYTRRKKQSNGGNIATIILSMIIVALLLFIFISKLQTLDKSYEDWDKKNPVVNNDNTTANWNNDYNYYDEITNEEKEIDNNWKYNDELSIKGTIISFPYDTNIKARHKILYNNTEIFLKSSMLDIDNFKDKLVVLTWTIFDFVWPDDNPVLLVKKIEEFKKVGVKDNEDEDNKGDDEKNEGNKKKNIYSGQWININVSNWENLEIDSSNGNIKIMSGSILTGNTLVTITPFKCSPEDYAKDCASLKKYFTDFKFKYTTNDNNITLWHMSEEQQRMAFGWVFWYKFKPTDNDSFMKLTNSFSFEDTSAMMNSMILATCNDISSQIKLTEIISTSTDAGNNQIVKGKDSKANDIICKLSVNYENGILVWKLIEIAYEISENGTVVSIKKPLEEKITEEKPIINVDNSKENNEKQVETWLNKADYLTYKSNGFGFEVWMPKNSKFEAPAVTKQPFTVAGLDCKQVVKIARYKGWDLANPDVKVYYCETSVGINAIKEVIWNSYRIVEKDDNIFIVKYADGYKEVADNLVLF